MLTNKTYRNSQYKKKKTRWQHARLRTVDILIQRDVLQPDKRDSLQTVKLISVNKQNKDASQQDQERRAALQQGSSSKCNTCLNKRAR